MAARGRKLLKMHRRAEFKHKNFDIRKGDRVRVMTGDDRGKVGTVLSVLPARERVLVEGVNLIYRHVRKSQQNPQGGRVQREGPIHISNVALIDEKTGRATRVRHQIEGDKKIRVSVRSGESLDR